MLKDGYARAIDLAKAELNERNPEVTAGNTGTFWNGSTYEIPWFHKPLPLDEGTTEQRVIWHHYLLAQGPKTPSGNYINYKQVPGAAIYNDNFIKRAIHPMVKTFSHDLELFLERGKALGGEPAGLGHMSFTLRPLPYVPLTYVIWQGDDEIPANGNILFDETAIDWFCAEDLVVLASMPVYMMMKGVRI